SRTLDLVPESQGRTALAERASAERAPAIVWAHVVLGGAAGPCRVCTREQDSARRLEAEQVLLHAVAHEHRALDRKLLYAACEIRRCMAHRRPRGRLLGGIRQLLGAHGVVLARP